MGTGTLCLYLWHPCQPIKIRDFIWSYLQEVTGFAMTALQKVSVPLLQNEVGNVAWDTNIQAIHDCQDQLWPAEGAQADSTAQTKTNKPKCS